jgi:hypothetical protein
MFRASPFMFRASPFTFRAHRIPNTGDLRSRNVNCLAIVLFLSLLWGFLPHHAYSSPPQPLQLSPEELQKRIAQAGEDPIALLNLSRFAEPLAAKDLRKNVQNLLKAQSADLPRDGLESLEAKIAQSLPAMLSTPGEVEEVLGSAKQVSRQILYRRYLEQWTYQQPLALVVLFECRQGLQPRLLSVQVRKANDP